MPFATQEGENMKHSQVSKCQREETEGNHTSSKGNQF